MAAVKQTTKTPKAGAAIAPAKGVSDAYAEKAARIFEQYPTVQMIYISDDLMVFQDEQVAKLHASDLDKKTVLTFKR